MNKKIKGITDSAKGFLSNFSKKTIIITASVAAFIIIGALVLTALMNGDKYVVLYPSLDSREETEIISEIQSRGIDFKEKDGTIYVPEEQEASLRMDLSNLGHPYSTYNYDFFLKNINVMTTDAERKIIEKYQLSQKLESVISTIDCIDRASVTINLAEESSYVLSSKSDKKSSAGVTLTVKQGKELSATQVDGIKTLISKSVPNLDKTDVTLLDNSTGIELGSSSTLEVDKTTLKLSLQTQYETDVENKVRTLLSKIMEPDKFQVVAKSNIDVDKGVKEIITYTPSENNRGVVQSEEHQKSTDGDGSTATGVPGTDSNTEPDTYSSITEDDNTIYVDSNDSYDYLVSQIKEQIQKDSAEIVDLTVSVAVNEEQLDDAQTQQLTKLVANSAGTTEDKVVVYNGSFLPKQPDEADSAVTPAKNTIFGLDLDNIVYILAIAGVSLILLIVILIVIFKSIGKKRNEKKQIPYSAEPEVDIMQDPTLEDFKIGKIPGPKQSKAEALKDQIQTFTGSNPEIAAQLVRTWLKGDEDGNDH